jgi:hypothetical protein
MTKGVGPEDVYSRMYRPLYIISCQVCDDSKDGRQEHTVPTTEDGEEGSSKDRLDWEDTIEVALDNYY